MQDENVGFGDSLTDFVEEKFLLEKEPHCLIFLPSLMNTLCSIAPLRLLTVFMSVDSAFPTRTKTSASKQKLSIQLSNSCVTSVPGLGHASEVEEVNNCRGVIGREEECASPIHQHKIVPQQGTAGFRPEDLHQTAGIQSRIHVESVSQLVDGLDMHTHANTVDNIPSNLHQFEEHPSNWPYADTPPLAGSLSREESLVSVSPLHPQEAIGGVADAAGQHSVSQHGINHRAFPIAGPKGTAASESDDAINVRKAKKINF